MASASLRMRDTTNRALRNWIFVALLLFLFSMLFNQGDFQPPQPVTQVSAP